MLALLFIYSFVTQHTGEEATTGSQRASAELGALGAVLPVNGIPERGAFLVFSVGGGNPAGVFTIYLID